MSDILDCTQALIAVRRIDPAMQMSVFAQGCKAACPGLKRYSEVAPSQKQHALIEGCCDAGPRKAAARKESDAPSPTLIEACGTGGTPPQLASVHWFVLTRVHSWLNSLAGGASDPRTKSVIADLFKNAADPRASFWLPLPSTSPLYSVPAGSHARDLSWDDRYILAGADQFWVGRWPEARLALGGVSLERTFPERRITLAQLNEWASATQPARADTTAEDAGVPAWLKERSSERCDRPLLIADRKLGSATIAKVVRAVGGCGVALAIDSGDGSVKAHATVLQIRPSTNEPSRSSAGAKQSGLIRGPVSPKVLKLNGTAADVARALDQLAADGVRAAFVE